MVIIHVIEDRLYIDDVVLYGTEMRPTTVDEAIEILRANVNGKKSTEVDHKDRACQA